MACGGKCVNAKMKRRSKPGSVKALEELGRVRLSEHFFMRDFLYSEIANFHGIPNIPDDPDLAIEAGSALCDEPARAVARKIWAHLDPLRLSHAGGEPLR